MGISFTDVNWLQMDAYTKFKLNMIHGRGLWFLHKFDPNVSTSLIQAKWNNLANDERQKWSSIPSQCQLILDGRHSFIGAFFRIQLTSSSDLVECFEHLDWVWGQMFESDKTNWKQCDQDLIVRGMPRAYFLFRQVNSNPLPHNPVGEYIGSYQKWTYLSRDLQKLWIQVTTPIHPIFNDGSQVHPIFRDPIWSISSLNWRLTQLASLVPLPE